jgi:hypothetical protein
MQLQNNMSVCLGYLLFLATAIPDAVAFVPTSWNGPTDRIVRWESLLFSTPSANGSSKNDDGDENVEDNVDDDDDDEDDDVQPYGSRSLSWTKRYRKLIPYEKCRQRVIRFGHRNKADWDEAVSSGLLGAYVPARPDEMYAPEWVSWDEWLGLMRSYEETRHLAVNVLGLQSLDEYINFVRQNPKRAEGLRIPVRPDIKFKEEWTSEEDFFRKS